MSAQVIWHGTSEESYALLAAVGHNCACTFNMEGAKTETCSAHRMMLEDQRALDGLVLERRTVEHWLHSEFNEPRAGRRDE